MKTLLYAVLALVVLVVVGGFYAFNNYMYQAKQGALAADVKNLTFTISGKPVTFVNGVSEVPAAEGSATMVTTRYFGNDVSADLNGDGVDDMAFLITQEPGGSGTFFYLLAAIKEPGGWRGGQAMLIDDRIAPQTTEFKNGLVLVNYATRKPGEPFTIQPSEGKTLYAKYDPVAMDFGEVVQNFEGESNIPGAQK